MNALHLKTDPSDRKGNKKQPPQPTPTVQQNVQAVPSLDLQKLGDDQVNVELYVKSILQKLPNEESVQQLSSQLMDAKDAISHELQRNVYKNYTEFVVISKEITKLEGDMIGVFRILSDLKDIREKWSQFTLDYESPVQEVPEEEIEENPKQKELDQSEIETRVVLMKSLYREIDGLQKALPDMSHRQLLFDGSAYRFFEVNPNTFKQANTIFLHVASDVLITAVWKKNVMSGKNRLAFERIFPITEIGFIDMKDSPELLYAFKIIKGAETYMYKAETLQEKKALLQVITQVTNQLVQQKKIELQTKKSQLVLSPTISDLKSPTREAKEKKKKQQDGLSNGDYMWLLELPDELDVLIAHRDFGQAITMIEKARALLQTCTLESPRLSYIRQALDERITSISRLVSIDLVSPGSTKSKIKEDISRLLRLGLGDQARDIYLQTRSQTIRHRLRQLQFNGDVHSFIYDYAHIFFRLLKNTCEWFSGSFHDASMASGFMKWVQHELDVFSHNVCKQIFGMQLEFGVIAQCVLTCLDLCEEMETVGMDLGHIFESFMHPELEKAIQKHGKECDQSLYEILRKDKWESLDPDAELFANIELKIRLPHVSQSCHDFYKTLTQFGSDIGVLISFSLYSTIVEAISQFFTTYVEGLRKAIEQDLELDQYIVILNDALFVVQYLFPHTKQQLQDRFDRIIPELEDQLINMEATLSHIQTSFNDNVFKRTTEQTYPFAKVDYTSSAQVLDTLMPSQEMINYVNYIRIILKDDIFDPNLIQSIVFRLLDWMELQPSNWTKQGGSQRKFGIGGVQLFILDLTYLQTVFESQLNESSVEKIKQLCEKSLRMYFAQNKDVITPLHGNDFYEERVADAIKALQI